MKITWKTCRVLPMKILYFDRDDSGDFGVVEVLADWKDPEGEPFSIRFRREDLPTIQRGIRYYNYVTLEAGITEP